jgi:hypothetical protein
MSARPTEWSAITAGRTPYLKCRSKLNFIFRWIVVLAVVSVGISRAQGSNGFVPTPDVYDGFETSRLSKVWDASRFVPGAVQMQTNVVRAGRSAAQVTVHTHDKFEAGINGSRDSERAELSEAWKLISKENEAYEYSFSMFIPTNFPIVPTRLVISQWRQDCSVGNCSDDSPVLAIRYASGVLKIVHNIGLQQTTLFKTNEELRGKWLDFKFQIRFSSAENGRIRAWLAGNQVVDYQGLNAYAENARTGYANPSHFYFSMGLYRDVMPEPMTIYIDEYRKRHLPANGL